MSAVASLYIFGMLYICCLGAVIACLSAGRLLRSSVTLWVTCSGMMLYLVFWFKAWLALAYTTEILALVVALVSILYAAVTRNHLVELVKSPSSQLYIRPDPYVRLEGKSIAYLRRAKRLVREPEFTLVIDEYLAMYAARLHT